MASNKRFSAMLKDFLDRTEQSTLAIAMEMDWAISDSTIRMWRLGIQPSLKTGRKFIQFIAEKYGEDETIWVDALKNKENKDKEAA